MECLPPKIFNERQDLEKALGDSFGKEVSLVDTLGTVTVVGTEINAGSVNLARGNAVLDDLGILGISMSPHRITWLLPTEMIPEAARKLHAEFL